MKTYWMRLVVTLTFLVLICAFGLGIGYTEEKEGVEGWEKRSVLQSWSNLIK